MNEAKVLRMLERLARILDRTANSVRTTAKEIQRVDGVFLVKSTFGYDVSVDGIDLGMDVAYNEATKIKDLIEDGRKK